MVTKLGYVIPSIYQWSRDFDINLDLFFASNQTSNIFHPILYILLSALDLPHNNLDITSHILASTLFGAKVLYVLQNQGQAACLMAGLREKTTYRSASF